MKVLVHIYFGNRIGTAYYGIYDYDTNTLQYLLTDEVLKLVKQGCNIHGLALSRDVNGNITGVQNIYSERQTVPFFTPYQAVESAVKIHGSDNKNVQGYKMLQPVHICNLMPKMYVFYKDVNFIYNVKRNKTIELGVFNAYLPYSEIAKITSEVLTLIDNVSGVSIYVRDTNTLDLSAFAPLSQRYKVTFQGKELQSINIKISGIGDNIVSDFIRNDNRIALLDLSELYSQKLNNYDFNLITYLKKGSLLLLPNNTNLVNLVVRSIMDKKSESAGRTLTDTENHVTYMGTFSKTEDYMTRIERMRTKYKLFNTKADDLIYIATLE